MSKRGRGEKFSGAPFVVGHMNGKRYYRRVPADVEASVGRKVWLHRFDPATPWAAIEHEAKRLASQHDDLIQRARNGEVLDKDLVATSEQQAANWLSGDRGKLYELLGYLAEQGTGGPADRAFLNAREHDGQYRPSNAMTVSAAYERDQETHGKDRDEKPIKYAVESFIATVADKPITEITRREVTAWLAKMESDGLAPGTIQRRLGAIRAMMNRAFLDTEYDGRNPFEKHKIKNGAGNADDRLPFNKAMLECIDSYLSSKRLGHETKNIIMMMKCTGGGPAEIGGLTLADVSLDGEIPFVWIRANAVRGLKTKVRDRRIPLIGDALDAARDAYERATAKAEKANADDTPLFKSFGAGGRGADSISAKLNKAIRSAGVPNSPRLVAYSFRHTMKESLRSAGVADHIQRRLLGHAGHGVADRYGSRHVRLAEAKDALTAAVDYLGDVDDAIYSAKERLK
ncbi:MAG: tyrosine-type recombinase/integrase [Rhodospirillales bacterium]|nr:tyrosine-type recombinase/integrase [Rhodospirillales bacterium]